MNNLFIFLQILFATIIIVLILVQNKGTGFGRVWGSSSFTRRGLEKIIFKLTFIVGSAFIIVSLLQITL